MAHRLIARIGLRNGGVVFERDNRIETAIYVDGTWTVAEEARVAEVVVDNRRVIDPVATTDHGLVIDRVCKTHSWAKIRFVRIDESEVGSL